MEEAIRIYGSRARIGLIVPGPNTVAETEFWRMAPEGVTVHTARLPFDPDGPAPLVAMEDHLEGAVSSLKAAGCDVIVYSCGASSAIESDDSPTRRIERWSGRPVVDASHALARELRRAGVAAAGLITPYPKAVHDHEKAFLEREGIAVPVDAQVILDAAQERLLGMRRVPPEMIVEAALPMASEVNGYALGCTDMPSLAAALEIETRTGKPVISMTIAMWREAGRMLKL